MTVRGVLLISIRPDGGIHSHSVLFLIGEIIKFITSQPVFPSQFIESFLILVPIEVEILGSIKPPHEDSPSSISHVTITGNAGLPHSWIQPRPAFLFPTCNNINLMITITGSYVVLVINKTISFILDMYFYYYCYMHVSFH